MSQLSAIFDEGTQELLTTDEDVKTLMAALEHEPLQDMNVNQNGHYPQEIDLNLVGYHHQQLDVIREMPQAEHPSSVANNNLERINKEDLRGEYKFEVIIDPHHGGAKSPWVYSSPLNKVFILISTFFPVDFKITPKVGEMMFPELFVRVTPSYSSAQDSLTPVTRCLQHMQRNENHDVPEQIWEHIIRCDNTNASYEGGKGTPSHLSVLVPLRQSRNGMDTIRNMYQFVCKNSCTGGMNRRALDIVFTLEDRYANILGRVVMNARICSCPKRDKEKEEKEHNRGSTLPPAKRRKGEKRPISNVCQSTSDLAEYELAPIRIPGKHNLQAIYKYINDLMAGEMLRHGNEGPYKRTILEINQLTKNAE